MNAHLKTTINPTVEPFAHAGAWLSELACAHDADLEARSLADHLRLLFGLWLCEQACSGGAAAPALAETARRVEATLRDQVRTGTFAPLAHDSTLLLLSARIVREQGRDTPGIDEYASQIAAALGDLPSIPVQFAAQAALLAALGYQPRPSAPPITERDIPGDALTLIRADKKQLRPLCAAIAAATHFGRVAPHGDPERIATLRLVLQPVLLDLLRRGDLDTAAPVLRALRYLRLTRGRTVRAAIPTIIRQQQPSGKFGYFTEMARAASDDEAVARNLDLGLHLPITVSCLWALAETTVPGFSVLNRTRRPNPPALPLSGGLNGH